jgi:proline iminopeptidase
MFITLGQQRIFFDVVGDKLAVDAERMREKPTLIVMHGGPGFDHSTMRPGFDQLADIAQVLYLDHRGNGRSVPSDPATWTLAQWGDDVHALCDALGIEKPIVLGQSFGGFVLQSYAIRHPSHPLAIILSSTAARIDLQSSYALFEAKGGAEARAIAERFWTTGDAEIFATYMRVCMPLYNTTVDGGAAYARQRAIMRPEVYQHFSLPGRELLATDFRPELSRIACPTLVMGGMEDPITPPHLAREMAQAIGERATLRLVPDAGHGAFRDDPVAAYDAIRQFIVEVAGA